MSEEKAATVVEAVTMTDGRVVNFAGKKKMVKSSEISGDAIAVTLDFRNGETRTFLVPDSLLAKFAAHGAEQKLGDVIAGVVEVEDCVLAIDELTAQLNAGNWVAVREKGGMSGTSVLIRALVEFTGKTVEAIKEYLAGKTQAEKLALRNNPKVKPIVERIEAEKAANKKTGTVVDTDSMLDELAA